MIAGKYILDRLLGQGGMGAVFAARHIKLSKPVAIKIMLADASSHEAAQRFINEGRAAANIQNEHVVRVDDVDEEMGYAYMVLELLDGEDLAQVLERDPAHRLLPHVAVGYVLQALAGVSQAHAIGIVHRDLKPSNLFLAKRKDGSVVVKVLDFGISKAQGSSALAASPSALTSTKAMLGSPLYMSPEQLRSSKSVDHRADIWAMGVILYELITGQLPFMGENLGELFAAILETDPTPLRTHVPDVPPNLEQVVLRCLQRRPEQRFETVTALTEALAPFTTPLTSAGGALGGTAMLAPRAVLPGVYPPGGATTPNGSRPGSMPNVAGTQALGQHGTGSGPRMAAAGVTPQGLHQTASGWQSTGGGTLSVPKSKAPLAISAAIAGVLLLLGATGVVFIVKSKGKTDPVAGSAAVTTAPPAPSPDPLPVTAPTPVEPHPSAPAASSVAVVEPAPSPATTSKVGANTKPNKASTPGTKVDPPKAPDPAPPAPAPKPTSKPNDGNLQNAR
ncbi:MAG: serine/threonine protein kinase [Labilithrix sp.]|nr:serine/threonine protein kinase [Labilithrix sp.]